MALPHQELTRCGIDCKEKEAAGSEIFQEFSKICTYYATSELCDRYCSATDQHLQIKIPGIIFKKSDAPFIEYISPQHFTLPTKPTQIMSQGNIFLQLMNMTREEGKESERQGHDVKRKKREKQHHQLIVSYLDQQ